MSVEDTQPLIAHLPPPRKVVLHYLGGRIEVELYLDPTFFANPEALAAARQRLADDLRKLPQFSEISLNFVCAL